jgi:hypothetical protein
MTGKPELDCISALNWADDNLVKAFFYLKFSTTDEFLKLPECSKNAWINKKLI